MKYIPNLEWRATLKALETTHTTSIRSICKLLKANRAWVNQYIVPNISEDKIYLSTGKGKNGGVNWVAIAARALERPDMTDACWYNTEKFMEFLKDSIKSVTRQTCRVPVELFVSSVDELKEKREQIASEIEALRADNSMDLAKKVIMLNKLYRKMEELWRSCVDEDLKDILSEGDCSLLLKKRSAVEPVDFECDVMAELLAWQAPHDVMEYGDTEEELFCRYFEKGFIRIELSFPSTDEKEHKKIYYLPDKSPIAYKQFDQYIPFRYEVWLKYKDRLLKSI